MDKEKILKFLEKYNYKFNEENNKIVVKLDFSQRVYLGFSEDDKIMITDRLTGWNFLTGFIEMNLKNAIMYNLAASLILGALFFTFQLKGFNMILIYFIIIFLVLFFLIFYLVRLEFFKTQIYNLTK